MIELPKTLSDPASLFWALTEYTAPYGTEALVYGKALEGIGFSADKHGNYFQLIEGGNTLFCAHMDTVGGGEPTPITRRVSEGVVRSDGTTVLGADDRAGMTVLLYLLGKGVPGLYYLFSGEERGCAGSKAVVGEDWVTHYVRAIAFDRRGFNEIITTQMGTRTCSDEFANTLCAALNGVAPSTFVPTYAPSSYGAYTDTYSFRGRIPECTNISVGYEGAHGDTETQDIVYLDWLCRAAAEVDWNTLPTVREPKIETTFTRRSGGSFGPYYPNLGAATEPSDAIFTRRSGKSYESYHNLEAATELGDTIRSVLKGENYEDKIDDAIWYFPRQSGEFLATLVKSVGYKRTMAAFEKWRSEYGTDGGRKKAKR